MESRDPVTLYLCLHSEQGPLGAAERDCFPHRHFPEHQEPSWSQEPSYAVPATSLQTPPARPPEDLTLRPQRVV